MRLPKVLRTTHFRIAIIYAGLFSVAMLLLFAAMYWYGAGYLAGQIDNTVTAEIAEVNANTVGTGLKELQKTVSKYSAQAPRGVFYLLEDRAGHVLAGNISALKPVTGVRTWPSREDGGNFPGGPNAVRGRGEPVAGGYLFVGIDATQLDEMRETIARMVLWGIVGAIVLALAGGMALSVSLLRRVESINHAGQAIIAGDLHRRIPIRGSDDEFDHLAVNFNEMLDRIENLMEGLRQVSSDIAHDLKTPLTRLRQRLERARRRASVEELHQAMDASIEDVDALLDTFGALLRIAQIEAHTKAVEFAPVDLTAMLTDMADTYQSVAEEKGQQFQANICPGLWTIGDRELLPQLFSNLIENAIRHSPTGATIGIEARPTSGGIEVCVTDNGPGIPPAMRDKVFQRFFRLEQSRTSEGTGLGLSLAAAIASLHGTRIALSDNEPGLRACLTFTTHHKTV